MLDDDRRFYPSGRFFTSALLGRVCGCREAEEGDERDTDQVSNMTREQLGEETGVRL